MSSGNLTVAHELASYRSLSVSRALRLVYNGLHADPQPVIGASTTISVQAAVPPTVSASLSVAGIDQGVEVFTDTSGLSESVDETIRQVVQFDAGALPTGLYPYELTLTSNYASSAPSSVLEGNVLVNNQRTSPFGAGWTLDGLQQLHLNLADRLGLTEGDGSIKVFTDPSPNVAGAKTFDSPPGEFSTLDRNADDTFTRTLKNGTRLSFDAGGFQTAIVDRNGNTTAYTYTDGRLTTITDPVGEVTTFAYTNGLLANITDPANRITGFEHDATGNLTRITDPDASSRQFAYDAQHRLTSKTSKRNFVTTYDYNFAGRNIQANRPDGSTRQISPAQTVELGDLSSGLGTPDNPMPVVRPEEVVATFTDGNGNVTTFTYDGLGNIATAIDAEGNVTGVTRDDAGNAVAITEGVGSPDERTSTFTYDALNRPLTATDATGATTEIRYDAAGNVAEQEDATNTVTTLAYDELNRITNIVDPLGGVTLVTYDANGNRLTVVDGLDQTTSFAYDGANRMVTSTDALGGVQSFTYDVQNNITSLQDARNQTTTFGFDLLNRQAQRSNPLGQGITFTYDVRGNLITRTDAKGQVTTNSYDDLSRLIQSVTPDNTTTLTYDPAGNPLTVADDDSALTFAYDGLNRIRTVQTGGVGQQPAVTLTSTYDAVGNRRQLADTEGGVTQFAYDDASRLIQLTTPAADIIDLANDPVGRLTQIAFPNAVVSNIQYDAQARLTDVSHTVGAPPAEFTGFAYTHNPLSNILSTAEQGVTRDPVVNRPISFEYDDGNRLIGDDDFTYTYDTNGNLATKTATSDGSVTTYTFDAQNQLVEITFPDATTATYRYDALGRRIEKNVNGAITRYVYDEQDILLEYDGSSSLVARYSHGDRVDQPLSMERGGQRFFYQADRLGSMSKLTDASGTVVNAYAYDAYGRATNIVEGVPNPFTYTGRERDAESGLYYYRAR